MALKTRTEEDKISRRTLQAARESTDVRTDDAIQLADFATKEECVVAIRTLWERSQRNFLTIGRYLIRAKEKLPHGDYEEMIRTNLPFSRSVAYMMRTVAESLESRKITIERLPMDYSTAYHLVSLPDDQYEMARQRDLVKPSLTRKEIMTFRRELTGESKRIDGLPKTRKALLKSRERLVADVEALQARIAEIDRRLGGEVIDGTARIIDVSAESSTTN